MGSVLSVEVRRPAAPGEDPTGEPFATSFAVEEGTTLSGFAEQLVSSGYLPGLPGDGAGLVWMLVEGPSRDPVVLLHGGGADLVPADRPLRAPYRFHLTVHPAATPEQVRRRVEHGPWDGPGRRPPRMLPGGIQVGLTRASVHAGDDAEAPHHRTLDLPAGATIAELAARVFASGYGASVVGGSVWLLRLGDSPVAVITQADADVVNGRARPDGTRLNPHSGRWIQASILVDSLLLVGRGWTPVDDGAEAHLEYRRTEPPFGVLDEARRSSRS
ncbi:hypothetical protein [Nocardioides sp. CFH 31398]|uniref:hypothetical protein n=1 Tax=Nocardioides sp. CFH 31398 TaxID=2919579 RepID=UPI001F054FE4|nr:hypothetical protein [Nocardioides sp. CFH 31398]MCH1866275.1 hypothetical protein [Nocardioides sp. CFH 31398]